VRSAILGSAAQVGTRRAVAAAVGLAVVVGVVLTVPMPTAVQLRDWANATGPWLPLAFLGAHSLITILPFPRTAFTLAAGLLFGPATGVSLAIAASTLSALIAMLTVRALGLRLSEVIPRAAALDARLQARGWPAVLSLRLIPAVPFSVLNYAAGASAVRVTPFALATLAGLVPGTTAVVILGDAMTGDVDPLLLLVSLCTATLGIAGLVRETRRFRSERSAPQAGPHPGDRTGNYRFRAPRR